MSYAAEAGAAIPGIDDDEEALLDDVELKDRLPTGSKITPLIASAGGVAGIILVVYAIWGRILRRRHLQRVAENDFDEGVIVFASGDVVFRFQSLLPSASDLLCCRRGRCCGPSDDPAITIENTYLSRADVEPDCTGRPLLRVYFLDVSAQQRVLTLAASLLAEPCHQVAGYINDSRDRSVLDAMQA
ncbi:hypothetical protein FNF31_03028 [Cafeteria roenbergensis]|uniref:Uncharacterized protein n=1 Tax=Cafeteria roenbergensis TaxID=33653 RepID=A0A5A8DBL9_CAFRO|nr:hypothetical protein FNF31_03028 [Cafeteria roenbergensis]